MQRGQAIRARHTHWATGQAPAFPAARLTGLIALAALLPGCLPETKPGFDSPAPSKRLDAIVQASELEDDESLVKLVEKLRSPVPSERMFAIRSLEIRTGETLGYDHAAEHWQRVDAYNRWLDWLEAHNITPLDDMTPIETPNTAPEGSGDQQPMEMEQPEG